MNCLICRRAKTNDGLATVILERGEWKFVVNNVPARVCSNCGEAYVDEVAADRLLQGAEERFRAGELSDVWSFELS